MDTTNDTGLLGDLDNLPGCRRLILIMFCSALIMAALFLWLMGVLIEMFCIFVSG
jgi:hypothetical protein